MPHTFVKYANDLFNLLYPRLCPICDQRPIQQQEYICLRCGADMTPARLDPKDNALMDRLVGLPNLEAAIYLLPYRTGGKAQQLIHELKYGSRPDIGPSLGFALSQTYLDFLTTYPSHHLVPVPLHHAKRRKRGYNQSVQIARGFAQGMQSKYRRSHLLIRKRNTQSQTQKSRANRLESMRKVFTTGKGRPVHQNIILIDDVVTSGATLHACADALLSGNKDLKFVVAAICMAV